MNARVTRRLLLASALVALASPVHCWGQLVEPLPAEMQGVGIDDKAGDQLPLDLEFRDERGQPIKLADLFRGDRPVLLTLNYSDCPMLCGVQLNGLFDGIEDLAWNPGAEFDVVSVSIDPLESPERAAQTKQRYLERLGRPGIGKGVRFLIGSQQSISALADAVGFRYKYVPETREYSHTAAVMVLTPSGVISRYLYGVAYDAPTLRLSLVEAGEGKIGSPLDQLILFCFHYDETKGRYGPVARRIMSAGAGVMICCMAVGLIPYWLRRSRDLAAAPTPPAGGIPRGGIALEGTALRSQQSENTPPLSVTGEPLSTAPLR
ncbi:MAG: SCO family protein [Lacipirellulaceae bacterium]